MNLLLPLLSLALGTHADESSAVPPDGGLGFIEVTASRLQGALSRLGDSSFVKLRDGIEGKEFGGSAFSCVMGNHPYLVRAEYSGWGEFTVRNYGPNLEISHNSMGRGASRAVTVLVLCTSFEVQRAHSSTHVAE